MIDTKPFVSYEITLKNGAVVRPAIRTRNNWNYVTGTFVAYDQDVIAARPICHGEQFSITKTSDYIMGDKPQKVFHDIQELLAWIVDQDEDVIIQRPQDYNDNKWTIEIYNDYRE